MSEDTCKLSKEVPMMYAYATRGIGQSLSWQETQAVWKHSNAWLKEHTYSCEENRLVAQEAFQAGFLISTWVLGYIPEGFEKNKTPESETSAKKVERWQWVFREGTDEPFTSDCWMTEDEAKAFESSHYKLIGKDPNCINPLVMEE